MNTKKYKSPGYFVDKAEEYGKKYGLKSNSISSGWNDEIDAFRHAYMQAYITANQGEKVAKFLGNAYEKFGDYTESQNAKERNMDLWNNEIGRKIGLEVKNQISHFQDLTTPQMFEDMIADRIYQKMKNGELITSPDDKRQFDSKNGKVTGQAADIRSFSPPYTRGDIGIMTPEEFNFYEQSIMDEMKNGKIVQDLQPTIYNNFKSKNLFPVKNFVSKFKSLF